MLFSSKSSLWARLSPPTTFTFNTTQHNTHTQSPSLLLFAPLATAAPRGGAASAFPACPAPLRRPSLSHSTTAPTPILPSHLSLDTPRSSVQTLRTRIPATAMPSITELPCEIVGMILRNLDHLRFLPQALLACRHFSTSFQESHGVEASILRRQITPTLLPHAVALMEASRLSRPLDDAGALVGLLDELHRFPARLAARASTLPPAVLRVMGRTRDAIHALATGFATSARQGISPSATTRVVLTPTEYFRFCRAFYRVELFYTLFRDSAFEDSLNLLFFGRTTPGKTNSSPPPTSTWRKGSIKASSSPGMARAGTV